MRPSEAIALPWGCNGDMIPRRLGGCVRPDEVRRHTTGRPNDRIEKRAVIVDAGSVGLPVGVQIAGLPNQDDVVLALMVALEGAARSDADFPTTPVDPT